MKLHLLLLGCLTILRVQCSQNHTNPEEDNQENESITSTPVREPLYPHRVGIVNIRYNCYMNALFSCLYNIHEFQDTVYRLVEELPEPLPAASSSTLVSLVDIFFKMRSSRYPVRLDRTMFPAINKAMNWKVGEYQCVLEFWCSFVETMPDRFKEIFQVKVATNYIRKSDGQLLKSIPDVYNYINIPLPEADTKISSIVASQFLDEEAEDYNVYPEDQSEYGNLFPEPLSEKLSIPVKSTVTFDNTPNILVFGIKRLNYNLETEENELNEVPVHFDHFTLKGECYVPIASVIFFKNHYYAIVRDVKHAEFYLHNDAKVKFLDTSDERESDLLRNIMMKQSVMVFYMKLSAFKQFKNERFAIIQANQDIPSRLMKEKAPSKPLVLNLGERTLAKRKKGNSDYSYRAKRRKFAKESKVKTAKASAVEPDNTNDEPSETENVMESSDEDTEAELESLTSEGQFKAKDDDNAEAFEDEHVQEDEEGKDVPHSQQDETGGEEVQGELMKEYTPNDKIDEDSDDISISSELLDGIIDEFYPADEVKARQEELLKAQILEQEQQKLIDLEKKRLSAQEARRNRMAIMEEKRKLRLQKKQTQKKSPQQDIAQLQSSSHSSPIESPPLSLQGMTSQQTLVAQSHQAFQHPVSQNSTFSHEELARIESEFEMYKSKLTNQYYNLGTEGYTFATTSSSPKSSALEYVLSAFAANSLFVRKIFSLANESDPNQWEHMISIALIQMLIGSQNITLVMLSYCLRKLGNLEIFDQDPGSLSTKVYQILNYFAGILNSSLIPYVSVKLITYSELETDEPLAINQQNSTRAPMFNSKQCIPPRIGKISGISIDRNWNGNRTRSVLNTAGMMLPFIIDRLSADGVLDTTVIPFGCQEYAILGGMFYSDSGELYSQFMSNYSQDQMFNFYDRYGGTFSQFTPEQMQHASRLFLDNISKRSHLLFAIKQDCWKIEPIGARTIPPFLAKYALKKIRERLFQISMRNCTTMTPKGTLSFGSQATGSTNHISGNTSQNQTASSVRQSHGSHLTSNLYRSQPLSTVNTNGNQFNFPRAPKNLESQNFKHFN